MLMETVSNISTRKELCCQFSILSVDYTIGFKYKRRLYSRTTGVREVIDLDVVVVTSSGNIDVSPCFLRPTVTDPEIIRMHRLVSPLQPTQHC